VLDNNTVELAAQDKEVVLQVAGYHLLIRPICLFIFLSGVLHALNMLLVDAYIFILFNLLYIMNDHILSMLQVIRVKIMWIL
jgi:hypothetical protein